MNNLENRIIEILKGLQKAGIVQALQEGIEFSHDSLAFQVAQKRSEEEKQLIRKANMVRQKFMLSDTNPDYLTANQLEQVDADLLALQVLWGREGLPEIAAFVEQSRIAIQEQEERERRIKRNKLIAVLAFILLLLVSLVVISIYYFNAQDSKAKATASLSNLKLKNNSTHSLRLAEKAYAIAQNDFVNTALTDAFHSGPFYYLLPPDSGRLMFTQFSSDGRYLLTGGTGEIVRLIDMQLLPKNPEQPQLAFVDLDYPDERRFTKIWEFHFDPSAPRFLAAGESTANKGWALVWDFNGKLLQEINYGRNIYACKFSPNGQIIATGADDKKTILWKASGDSLLVCEQDKLISDVAWSPDGEYWISASYDGSVWLGDTTGNILEKMKGHTKKIEYTHFSPDGQYILTSSGDGKAIVWNTEGDSLKVLDKHRALIRYAEFSPDGSRVITASYDDTAILWDWENDISVTLAGHSDRLIWACFSPDGQYVITSGNDGLALIWDHHGKLVQRLKGSALQVQYAEISPAKDQFLVATGDKQGRVGLWDIGSSISYALSISIDPFVKPKPASTGIYHAAYSNSKELFLTTGEKTKIQLWDDTGQALKNYKRKEETELRKADFSPDGKKIIVLYKDFTAYLIDLERDSFYLFSKFDSNPYCLAFSPDGKMVAIGFQQDNAIREKVAIYEVETGILIAEKQHDKDVNTVAFSPDGQTLISASRDESVRLWSIQDSLPLMRIVTDNSEVATNALFSPDGQNIITAWRDNYIRIYDIAGKLLREFEAHSALIYALDCFEYQDGRVLLASGGEDKTIRVWNLEGEEKLRFTGHWDRVRSLEFSPDGQFLLSSSSDETAKIWPIDLQNSPAAILPPKEMLHRINELKTKGMIHQLDSLEIEKYGIE